MDIFLIAVCLVIGYLLGNFQTSILLSKYRYKDDIRTHGSRNAGSTNMLRVFGLKSGLITFLGDLIKGILAVLIGRLLLGWLGGYVAGLGAVLGHNFPVFLGFKGGKGVATTIGIIWMISPLCASITTAAAITVMVSTGYVSLGSLVGAAVFVVCAFIFNGTDTAFLIFSCVLAALVFIRHAENIKRILNGTESKLMPRKKKA